MNVHSIKNFQPQNYVIDGWYYIGTREDMVDNILCDLSPAAMAVINKANITAKCCHCGAAHKYGAIFQHTPTGELVTVGWTCVANTWSEYADAAEYHHGRMQKRSATQRRKQKMFSAFTKMCDETDPKLSEAFQNSEHRIIKDIFARGIKWGGISPAQVSYVLSLRDAELNPKVAAEKPTSGPAPTGRTTVSGTITSIKWKDSIYGGAYKMTVKLPNGSRVWGTTPKALLSKSLPEDLVNVEVEFSGTFEQSSNDKSFGFFKRPTNAEQKKK